MTLPMKHLLPYIFNPSDNHTPFQRFKDEPSDQDQTVAVHAIQFESQIETLNYTRFREVLQVLSPKWKYKKIGLLI